MKSAVNTLTKTVTAVAFALSTSAAIAGGYYNNPQPGSEADSESNSVSQSGASAGVNANLGQSTNVGVGQSAKLNGGNTHVDNEIQTGDVAVNQGPVTSTSKGGNGYGGQGGEVEAEINGTNHQGQDQSQSLTDNSDRTQTQTTDASSQNEISQHTNQHTNVDNSGSGNSENANTQNTAIGGNNSVYENNSVFKTGAAANIPNAAAVFATKSCVSSHSFGIGGGNVLSGYGGLSWTRVGSEAVALKGTLEGADGELIDVAYTIPEVAEMSAQERAQIVNNLRDSEAAKATCLIGEYQTLVQAYEHATNVAEINAKTNVAGKQIDGYTRIKVEEIRQAGQAATAAVNAQGEVARIGMIHNCNGDVTVIQTGEHTQQVVPETMAIGRGTVSETNNGHELCGVYTGRAIDSLSRHSDNSKATEVNFDQFTPKF